MNHGESTLAGTIDDLDRLGFTEHFGVVADSLRGFGSRATFRPDELEVRDYFRFEGVSDPDDMAILYAIESRSGIRGTLVDAFGVYSDPAVSAFMERVALARGARSRARAASA
jgi:hypothetical protein